MPPIKKRSKPKRRVYPKGNVPGTRDRGLPARPGSRPKRVRHANGKSKTRKT